MNRNILYTLIIIFNILSFIKCYNNSHLKNVTADDLEKYSREDGYAGCYALYDSGANSTEICTQFKLEPPYVCCRVHYRIGDFRNDFCMPISKNERSLKDVVNAFYNADDIDIDCYSLFFKYNFCFLLILFIL